MHVHTVYNVYIVLIFLSEAKVIFNIFQKFYQLFLITFMFVYEMFF